MANENPPQNLKPISPASPRNKELGISKQTTKAICPPNVYNDSQQPKAASAESRNQGNSYESRRSKILHALATPSKFVGWNRKVSQPVPMDMWDQARLNKVGRHPNLKQHTQHPRLAIQPGIKTTSRKETKEAASKNTPTFKPILKSSNQPKVNTPSQLTAKCGRSAVHPQILLTINAAKNETVDKNKKAIPAKQQKHPLVIHPHALRFDKDEPRMNVGTTAAKIENDDSSEMTELVKLLVKLTDENMKLRQNLQAFNASGNESKGNTNRIISENEQKLEIPALTHGETKIKIYETKLGVASANSKDNGSLDITPLVKLLIKLTDEQIKQKNANVKTKLQQDQKVVDNCAIYKDTSPPSETDSDEHSGSPCDVLQGAQIWRPCDPPIHGNEKTSNLLDEAEDIDKNERREQKKAELKEKFYAGVEDPNLRKQFNYLLKQEDLNEIIDQMLIT